MAHNTYAFYNINVRRIFGIYNTVCKTAVGRMVRSRGTLGSISPSILTAVTSHEKDTYQDTPHMLCIYGIHAGYADEAG